MGLIEQHRDQLAVACEKHRVSELYAFGSVLTDQFEPNSDIDFIVSIQSEDPIEYAEHYFELKFALEQIFNRQIDLLEQKAIRNKLFAELINDKKQLVYARGN